MRTVALGAALALVALAGTAGGAAPADPEIVGVYPNPVTDGDAGEFVALAVPPGTDLGRLVVADGESVARGPNRTAGGVVYLSTTPDAVTGVDGPVYRLRGDLSLSNDGERVAVRRGERVLDATTYPRAPEAEVWNGSWRPLGATDRAPTTVVDAPTRAFALPDGAAVPAEFLRSADSRLLLAGYTLRSSRAVEALLAAAVDGVDVAVLVEGDPVGGVEAPQPALLDRLAAAGVTVTAIDGPRARFRYHHAKYAVADDRVLVASENWGPTGTGGGNRGWGAVVESDRLADRLASVFRSDAGWLDGDTRPDPGATGPLPEQPGTTYPTRFPPVSARANATLLLAPDNAGSGIRRLVRSAEQSLFVQQVRIAPDHAFLNATIAAARRGVRVRVLLSGRWYVAEENRRVVRRLDRLAEREGLALDARLAEPRSRYRSVHVKGVVADRERVLVGSVNWNDVAVTENREAALVVRNETVAGYFARVFVADWRGGAWRVPAGVVVAVAAAVSATVALVWRRVSFGVSEAPRPGAPERSRRRPSSRPARRERPPASRRRT